MAVHQQTDDQRGGDERTSPAVAEHEPEHESHKGRGSTMTRNGSSTWRGFGLAQVLRPQEQHGVGGEQQGMDGGKSIARAGAVDCGNAGQGDLRSERLFG